MLVGIITVIVRQYADMYLFDISIDCVLKIQILCLEYLEFMESSG